MEHENEHLDIREKLLRLPKVQADDNFLKRLQIQIDILDSEERTRDVVDKGSVSGYFKNLFGARLMPALGISSVIVVAVLVYFVLADKKDTVVNNMTGKTQETTITPEKPGNTNSTPTTENKQLAKTEESDSKDKIVLKKEDNFGYMPEPPKVVTDERNLSQEIEKIKSPESSPEPRGIVTTQQPPVITSEKSSVAKAEEKKKSEDKVSDSESNTETMKTPPPPTATKDQEKSVNEGGRGNTDTKTPKSSIKPKKKDLNGVIDINKSVLESLRDKLK